jgi:hypothetical protein
MSIKTLLTRLPKTGQTTSYAAGDDGDYQKGDPLTRFVDTGKNMIFDQALRVYWIQKPELIINNYSYVNTPSLKGSWVTAHSYAKFDVVQDPTTNKKYVCNTDHISGGANLSSEIGYWDYDPFIATATGTPTISSMNYTDILSGIESLNYNGFSDWRMANKTELYSLIDYSLTTAPMVNATFFPTFQDDIYWTTSPYAQYTPENWTIDLASANDNINDTSIGGDYLRYAILRSAE